MAKIICVVGYYTNFNPNSMKTMTNLYINTDFIVSVSESNIIDSPETKCTCIIRGGELWGICTFESLESVIKKINGSK